MIWSLLLWVMILNKAVAKESCEKYSIEDKYDQYNYLVDLVRSSTFPFDEWHIKPKDVNLIIDGDHEEYIGAVLKDANREPFTTGTIGWIKYDKVSGKLFDNSTHLEEPVELEYTAGWDDVMQTVFSNQKQRYLRIKEKSSLYTDSHDKAKSKKFLIKGDCAFVLNKSKKGWYHVYFLHSQWRTQTIMWIKDNDAVELVK